MTGTRTRVALVAALVFFAALLHVGLCEWELRSPNSLQPSERTIIGRFSSSPPFEPGSEVRARQANARSDAFVFGVALPLALLAAIPFLRRHWTATDRRRLGRCVDCGHQMTDPARRRCAECGVAQSWTN